MTRRQRADSAGVIHHVINRGIAKRTCFERRADVRKFLAELARAVRRREIDVLAYSVLTTHFHLVLRSLQGELSEAMRRIQNAYVRAFNRQRRRDGPLFRGRFWSRPVHSEAYLRMLVRYVDHNAVEARLASSRESYPWCSAWHHGRGSMPPWLEGETLDRLVASQYPDGLSTPARYVETFGRPTCEAEAELIESRASQRAATIDPLDDLIDATSERVLEWMVRKARLADGTRPGLAVVGPTALSRAVADARHADPDWTVRPTRLHVPGWSVLESVLLRLHCGCTLDDAALRVGVSPGAVAKRVRAHARLLGGDPAYTRRAADVLRSAMNAANGVGP